jgi:hypothetical protein
MSPLKTSNSATARSPLLRLRQQITAITQPQPKKIISTKLILTLLAALIILLGYANLASAETFRKSTHAPPTDFGRLFPESDATATLAISEPRDQRFAEISFAAPPTPTPLPAATITPVPTTSEAPLEHEAAFQQNAALEYVVIITIDGLRPDALDLTDTPTLDALRAKGAFSPNAQTISLSETLPSHASLLSGMTAEKHGIQFGVPYMGWPGMNGPTVFSVAHEAGLSTGMVFGKDKLNYIALPNSVDFLYGGDAHDPQIKEWAVELIEAGLPNVLFIHLPDTDRVGHAYGWLSPNQLFAVTFADSMIGEIVTALETEGYLPRTLLIITADHGGHDKGHGNDCLIDRTIPWLAAGPGVAQGVTLNSNINIYDTAATALHALELPIPENWDGQPVLEIFE